MKQTIKSILAFAAVLLCGGAWALDPIVIWDSDMSEATATKRGTDGNVYKLDPNGNKFENGCIKITANVGAIIDINQDQGNAYAVLVRYSGLDAASISSRTALASVKTAKSGVDNIGVAVSDSTLTCKPYWNGTDYAYSSNAPVLTGGQGYFQICYKTGQKWYTWAGASLNEDGCENYDDCGLAFTANIQKLAIGGPVAESNNAKACSGLKIESIALFKTTDARAAIADTKTCESAPSDAAYVAKATSETSVDLSALTWMDGEGQTVAFSDIDGAAKIAVLGKGKVNVVSRSGDIWLSAGVTGALPNTGTVSTKFVGYGKLEKNGTGDLTLSGASTNVGGLDILAGSTKAGANGGLGVGIIRVAKGATMDIGGYNGATGGYVVESAGSLKNSGGTKYADALCIKSLTLLDDTEFVSCNKRFGVSLNTQTATLVDLGNHTLTLNTGDYVNFRRTEFRGTGRVVVKNNTKMLVYDNTAYNSTMSDGTLILESGSHLELNVSNNGTLTIKNFVQKGAATHKTGVGGRLVVTGSYDVSAATTTTTNSSVPKLKLNGATVVFPANTAAGTAFSLNCTDLSSDSSVKSGEHAIQVGDIAVMGTLTLNTTDKTVQYATNGSLVLKPTENAIKLTDINAFAGESAVTVEMPDNSYLDINTDSVTPASVTVNNAGKLTVVKTTSTGWGTITAETLPSKITIQNTDAQHLVFDDGSVKAEYFGKATTYWSNVYAGPTTSSEAGDASASGQWWKRSSDSKPLYTSSNNWNPTLFDGNLIPLVQVGADGYKTINALLSSNNGWEGWQLRVGAVNGVKINVAKLVKIQDNADVGMLIGVDETSKVIIENYANGNNEREITFDIAAPEGLVFNNNLNASANGYYAYKFHAKGSVLINGAYNIGSSHKIKEMKLVIGNGRYKSIIERKLIGWNSSALADNAFTVPDDAVITTSDDQIAATPCANAVLTLLDDLGTYLLVKKTDGLYVQYIGYSDETPTEYMWKFNKVSGNWGDADAWTGVLDTTGATHSWSELEGSATPVTVFLDANVTSEITIDGTINATKVVLTNTSTDPKPFAFNTTYEGEGGSQTVPENVKLTAPVDATAFNGELGLRGVITGEVIVGPATQIIFVAPTADQQTTAHDYNLTGYENTIEVRGPGTFRVPSTMYTRPFNVMPMKVNGEYSGEAGYILYAIAQNNTITVDDVISGQGGVKKSGLGELRLSGENTYTGGTIVMGGTIQARTGTADTTAVTSFGVGDVDVRNGATLDIYGRYLANQIYIAGDGVGNNGALINTGTDLGKNLGNGNNWKISLRANSSWGGNYFTHFGSNAVVALGGFTFTKKGSNLFPLNATAGITNGKIVVEAGEFQNNGGVNNLSTVDLEIKGGATLNMNKGTSLTVKSFKCEGSITGTNAKLIIAENGTLNESSADIGKLELKNNVTVVAAANKKIAVTGEFTCGETVKVNASAKTEESDITLFTMPSEADAIALAAKISLVDDTEHILVAKGADVCLAPTAISGEDAFETAVATAGDVILGGNLTLTKTIQVADGVTIILGENTISGGTLNLASGTISFHVEQGKSTTISSTITGAAKIQKTGGGELTMSANNGNFTGSWEVVGGDLKGSQKLAYGHDVNGDGALTFKVDAGATLYVDKMDDISYNLVMAGGTVKNGSGNNIDPNHRQIRKMTLEADSRVEGANFGFVPGGHDNGKLILAGHTLTVAMSDGKKFAFDGMSDDDVGGVIKVISGKIGNASVQHEAVLSHTPIVLEGGAFECERQMTVKSVKVVSAGTNSGILKVKECVEGALSMPTLTLDDNATIKLANNQSVSVSSTLTLGANLKVNLTGITTAVGGEMTVLTAPSSFSFGSKTLTCVNNEGAADNTWILKANGNTLKAYRNAEVGGNTPTTAIGDDFSNIVMASVDKITVADIAEKYEVAARFTNTDVGASDKTSIVVGSEVVDGNYNIQFQIVDGYLKWCNVQLKVELDNATGLYLVKVKRVDSAYHNETADVEKVGKKQTGGTSHNYYVCSFSLTPGALQPKLSYDSRIVNGVLVGFDSSITQPWFNAWNGEFFVATTKTIGAEPGSEVATVANGKTPHANNFNFLSVPGVTMAMYANALNVQPSGNKPFLSFGGNGTGAIFINLNEEGKPELIVNTNPVTKITCDSTSFADNGFHLYVATIDAKRVIRFYVDSELIGTCYKSDFTPGTALQVGKIYANLTGYDRADNLAVANLIGFPRSLTEVQVAELAERYPFVPMAKAEGVDTPIRGVDASELVKKYNADKPGSAEAATSINSEGVNGLPLWKSDILGLNPTDENSRTVVISGAQTTETGSMKLLTGIKPNPEIMTVTLKSGATAACEDTDVTPMSDDGSFTVTLPTGDDKVKYYKLTYEFSSAE